METNEIMIGNYLQTGRGVVKVVGISIVGVSAMLMSSGEIDNFVTGSLEGIKLREEHFLKNNWQTHIDEFGSLVAERKDDVLEWRDGAMIDEHSDCYAICREVHKLQNLLQAVGFDDLAQEFIV